jgi:hypothetical protein
MDGWMDGGSREVNWRKKLGPYRLSISNYFSKKKLKPSFINFMVKRKNLGY